MSNAGRLVLGLMIATMSGAGQAAEPRADVDDEITVVATLSERSLDDVAATVSVLTEEEMVRQVVRDIRDLVRYEPGVSVGGTGSRFGLDGFNIRGIGGNRVLTLVDGIRAPEEFSFGPFLDSRRDFVDVDAVQRVEISRGPISTLYGSDALGGVVAFTTRRPGSYVSADDPVHASARAGYSSDDSSLAGSATIGLGNDRVAGLLSVTRREAEATENAGSVGGTGPARERPDPQDVESRNIDFKLAFTPAEAHELLLAVEDYDNQTDSDLLSDYGVGSTVSRVADDTRDRRRYSLHYTYAGSLGIADRASVLAYHQRSDSLQIMNEVLNDAGELIDRVRESRFEQEVEGAKAVLAKALEIGGSTHYLSYGGEYYLTRSKDLRDGASFLRATGAALPENLPTRDFPPTRVEQAAVFLQDEMEFLDGRLTIVPGVRYDDFDASVSADQLYLEGNPGTPLPEDYGDSEVTLKVGSVFKLTDLFSVFARYAEGFRAPPYDDVNVGFTNFIGGYKTISNPGLQSETSTGVEVGFRLTGRAGSLRFAAFRNDYDDFIESFAIAPQFQGSFGIDPSDGLLTFQSINRGEVEIEGAELQATLLLGDWLGGLEGLFVRTAIAYAEGEDDAGTPVNSVEPLTGIVGVGYEAPGGRWGGEVVWTLVDGKKQSDISGSRLPTDGYGLVDLLAHARFGERVRVNVGLFNIGDRSYIRWADTAAIGSDAPVRFSQPGFHAGATVRVEL